MPRITKKELQEQLEQANRVIELQQKSIQKLQEKIDNILDNKNAVEKEEFNVAIKNLERIQINYKTLENQFKREKQEKDILSSKVIALENNNNRHNSRGAGRKSKLTVEQINKILLLRQEGLSYGAIAKEVKLSKAYVYKLINKR